MPKVKVTVPQAAPVKAKAKTKPTKTTKMEIYGVVVWYDKKPKGEGKYQWVYDNNAVGKNEAMHCVELLREYAQKGLQFFVLSADDIIIMLGFAESKKTTEQLALLKKFDVAKD